MRLSVLLCLVLPSYCFAQDVATLAAELGQHRKNVISQLLLDPRSPIDSTTVHQLRYHPANDTFVFQTIILPLLDDVNLNFPTSDGKVKPYRAYAKLYFRYKGGMHSLTVYESERLKLNPLYRDKLFLPFWDDTNGFESYGGGRYIDVSRRAVDDRSLVLDFNRAYNPWCAYADDYSCPLPPAENRLVFGIRAGEADFAGVPAVSAQVHVAPAERVNSPN